MTSTYELAPDVDLGAGVQRVCERAEESHRHLKDPEHNGELHFVPAKLGRPKAPAVMSPPRRETLQRRELGVRVREGEAPAVISSPRRDHK